MSWIRGIVDFLHEEFFKVENMSPDIGDILYIYVFLPRCIEYLPVLRSLTSLFHNVEMQYLCLRGF